MLLQDLVSQLFELVQQPSDKLSLDVYEAYAFEALDVIAEEVLLPSLDTFKVQTVTDYTPIPLPVDFHRNVYQVKFNGKGIQIFKTLDEAKRRLSDGYLSDQYSYDSCLPSSHFSDSSLYDPRFSCIVYTQLELIEHQDITFPADLTLSYYRKPYISKDIDCELRDILPIGFSENIVKEYVLWKVYKWIEDGETQERLVNTTYHRKSFYQLLTDLQAQYVGRSDKNFIPWHRAWL